MTKRKTGPQGSASEPPTSGDVGNYPLSIKCRRAGAVPLSGATRSGAQKNRQVRKQ